MQAIKHRGRDPVVAKLGDLSDPRQTNDAGKPAPTGKLGPERAEGIDAAQKLPVPQDVEPARRLILGHSRDKVLRHIVLPQLFPFLVAAARSGLSLIWKIVLVVELLGRSNGVGFQLYVFFQLFDVASILAYTLAFVAVVQVIELTILQPMERRANRWRR